MKFLFCLILLIVLPWGCWAAPSPKNSTGSCDLCENDDTIGLVSDPENYSTTPIVNVTVTLMAFKKANPPVNIEENDMIRLTSHQFNDTLPPNDHHVHAAVGQQPPSENNKKTPRAYFTYFFTNLKRSLSNHHEELNTKTSEPNATNITPLEHFECLCTFESSNSEPSESLATKIKVWTPKRSSEVDDHVRCMVICSSVIHNHTKDDGLCCTPIISYGDKLKQWIYTHHVIEKITVCQKTSPQYKKLQQLLGYTLNFISKIFLLCLIIISFLLLHTIYYIRPKKVTCLIEKTVRKI
ncbi:uncharacterized protein LOC132697077 [Cylas formicarius]|uniref:uncharacterized protein LOC132697077 n=1 Tax=Cylas formicarius TaxID=197179 RepID=UPI00295877F0|nr:uncharacterized protein LOC132697077 [Cylas formicarius]